MRFWLVCLAAVLLVGCAKLQDVLDTAPVLGPPLQRLTTEGRISLRQGERRDHLRFRWEHTEGGDVVLLMSPLGQGLAELRSDATGARLTQPNHATITAENLPILAQHVFGTPLPLDVMADLLRGARPAPNGEIDGWRVVISGTSPFRQSRLLRVLEASRKDVELKLIVDDWDAPE